MSPPGGGESYSRQYHRVGPEVHEFDEYLSELNKVRWLCQVRVCLEFVTIGDIGGGLETAPDGDWDSIKLRIRLKLFLDIHAVHARQIQIQQDDIRQMAH